MATGGSEGGGRAIALPLILLCIVYLTEQERDHTEGRLRRECRELSSQLSCLRDRMDRTAGPLEEVAKLLRNPVPGKVGKDFPDENFREEILSLYRDWADTEMKQREIADRLSRIDSTFRP